MKKIFRIILLVAVAAIFLGTMGFLYSKSREEPEVFETQQPVVTDIVKKTVATGSVVPRKEIEIKPKVSGIVDKIYVEAGQHIKKGDLIAKVAIIPDMVTLNSAESRVRKAEISLENARQEYNRQKTLYESGVTPEAEFQKVEIELRTAEEELETAKDNLQLIREGVSRRSGQATNTLIRSTIEGMVLDVPIEEGNSVIESNTFNEGTTIAVVADMGEMIFEGKVDETEVGKITTGMDLQLSVGAIEDTEFDATLEYISPKGVEENGAIQFEIKAAIELRADYFIRAGYSANANIVLDHRDSVLAISESLLQFEEDSDSMFVEVEVAPQEFEKRYVKTGLSDGINIEILEGLSKEDKIKVVKLSE